MTAKREEEEHVGTTALIMVLALFTVLALGGLLLHQRSLTERARVRVEELEHENQALRAAPPCEPGPCK
jgi:hypothetical protein